MIRPTKSTLAFISCLALLHTANYLLLQLYSSTTNYSMYYAPDMSAVGRNRVARVKFSEVALKTRSGGGGLKLGLQGDCGRPTFCVGVVGTEGRLHRRYLLQSVGSLMGLGGVGSDCRTKEFFTQLRREPGKIWLEGEEGEGDFKLLRRAGVRVDIVDAPTRVNRADEWVKQEIEDYVQALQKCYDSEADYAVIIEEDVWSTSAFMDKLERSLEVRACKSLNDEQS